MTSALYKNEFDQNSHSNSRRRNNTSELRKQQEEWNKYRTWTAARKRQFACVFLFLVLAFIGLAIYFSRQTTSTSVSESNLDILCDDPSDCPKLLMSQRGAGGGGSGSALSTTKQQEYELSKEMFNKAIENKPKYVFMCHNADDVRRAVDFAQKSAIPLAIHS